HHRGRPFAARTRNIRPTQVLRFKFMAFAAVRKNAPASTRGPMGHDPGSLGAAQGSLRVMQGSLRATQRSLRATQRSVRVTKDPLRGAQDLLRGAQRSLRAGMDPDPGAATRLCRSVTMQFSLS